MSTSPPAPGTPPSAPASRASECLFLLDAHSHLHRAYHAVAPLSTANGFPTNALYGFVAILGRLMKTWRPRYVAAIFDSPGPSFRQAEFADYKANRPPLPEDLRLQIEKAKQILDAMRIPRYELAGYEADDLIATLVRHAAAHSIETWVVSVDKDLFQLVAPGVKMLRHHREKEEVVDEQAVHRRLGVRPDQVADYLALVGDSSDNIPGVRGIGPKTAVQLLDRFGTLDNLLARLAEIEKPRWRALLAENADTARLSKRLVLLREDCPVPFDPNALQFRSPPAAALRELYRELEFHSFLRDLAATPTPLPVSAPPTPSPPGPVAPPPSRSPATGRSSPSRPPASRFEASNATLFDALDEETEDPPVSESRRSPDAPVAAPPDGASLPPSSPSLPPYETIETRSVSYASIRTEEALRRFVAEVRAAGRVAVDTETTALDVFEAALVGISLSIAPDQARYIPIGHDPEAAEGPQLPLPVVREHLGPLLADPAVEKVFQNLVYDYKILVRAGFPRVEGVVCDTMLASYLLNPERRGHGLKAMARDRLGVEMTPIANLIGEGTFLTMANVAVSESEPYACQDADLTFQLAAHFQPLLQEAGLLGVLRDIETPLAPVLAEMEMAGIRIDTEQFRQLRHTTETRLREIERQAHELAGRPFNLASPKQVAHLLFEDLKLPPKRKGKTGYSTDVEVLEQLRHETQHPLLDLLLEYRGADKLLHTYIVALPRLVHPRTGRIHTSFNQTITATGRLSSSEPNLQNIPVRTPQGRMIRQGFVPSSPDHLFLAADYSQIELRILAHLSGDPSLCAAFRAGGDIHRATAARIFRCPPDEVDDLMRDRAKTVNFGVIYGISAHGLSLQLGIPRKEAQAFIEDYFAAYPGVKAFIDATIETARKTGEVRTLLGRRRAVPDLSAGKPQVRGFAERIAVNTPIQGTSADMIKLAMIAVQRRLHTEKAKTRMILQVHDELVFDAPAREIESLKKWVSEEMEAALPLNVPVRVDIKTGRNWAEC